MQLTLFPLPSILASCLLFENQTTGVHSVIKSHHNRSIELILIPTLFIHNSYKLEILQDPTTGE